MSTALNLNLTFNQVLNLVKQLPAQEKLKLSKELEKDVIESRLTFLLEKFTTNEISDSDIEKEVDIVRQKTFDHQKH